MPTPVDSGQARGIEELELPPEDRIYFNGYQIAIAPTDIVVVLMLNGKPIKMLNASHVTAKTLLVGLDSVLKEFEKRSGQPILTIDEVQASVGRETT
jgi:hypothetical protein